jgi:hypothetical protein
MAGSGQTDQSEIHKIGDIMSKVLLCARCYATPEAPATTFKHMLGRLDGKGWDHYCSEDHMRDHQSEGPVNEAARVGLAFMNASLMMHMFMSIGRTDEPAFAVIQARRVLMTERLQFLATLDEVKEIML